MASLFDCSMMPANASKRSNEMSHRDMAAYPSLALLFSGDVHQRSSKVSECSECRIDVISQVGRMDDLQLPLLASSFSAM
jgi:hypothetical protein